jgi:DNA end-binding protein Ku
MAARAIWKGVIRFESVEVPVKLYSAVESGGGVHFRLLDEETETPVRQRMVHPRSGDEVPFEETRKGYEVDKGTFVVLEDEELEELQPEPSRDIEITRFVPTDEIDHRWYDRPYYLGPDTAAGETAEREYFALAEALAKKDREGVARWTMRNKEYVGALRPEGDHLVLVTLHHAGEVIPASELEAPSGRALASAEVAMAEKLVSALEDEPDLTHYRDEYRGRVLELVRAKAEGRTIEAPEPEPEEEAPESLSKALEASLARAEKERKGAKASGKEVPAKGKTQGKKAPAKGKAASKKAPPKRKGKREPAGG